MRFQNRQVYCDDNLSVLRDIDSESVDLIATDPPYNNNKEFKAPPGSLAAGAEFVDRRGQYGDTAGEWYPLIDKHPGVLVAVNCAYAAHGKNMGDFIGWMGARLLECYRILRSTGSLYLHCDDAASHYIKILLDAVFGSANFRSEIVWKRSTAQNNARKYGRVCDIILFYTKSDDYTWHQIRQELSPAELKKYSSVDAEGRRYKCEPLIMRSTSPSLHFTWRGATPPPGYVWRYNEAGLERLLDEGKIELRRDGAGAKMAGLIKYLDENPGQKLQNLWTDIHGLGTSNDRTGYPTQKPVPLYERIIRASSNPGDFVLDPFCGSGTTLIAAENLGREWAGIDVYPGVRDLVQARLGDRAQVMTAPIY